MLGRFAVLLLLLLLTLYVAPALPKIMVGQLETRDNWAFLGRFCFLSGEGKFEYLLEYDKVYAVQNLLLYYDTYDQWTSAYYPGLSCQQREALAQVARHQVVNLSERVPAAGCEERLPLLRCRESRRFSTARQRWWFVALSNCRSTRGLSLKYKFWMTNGPQGDFWHEHFSADEFLEMRHRQLLHSTYKLFLASVASQQLGILLQSAHYIKYALDGAGHPYVLVTGRLLEAVSETVFLLLLLLLAKGFTVTRGRLRLASTVKLTVFMCLYCITYCALFAFERLFFDPGKVLYLYESPAGYGLIMLRGVAWSMFIYAVVFTLQHYPAKSNFYYPFNLLGSLWFVLGPAFVLVANAFIDNWVRESLVCGIQHLVALIGHLVFLFLTVPSRGNKMFPYHVRTSQVDVLRTLEPDPGMPFGPHAYAVGEWASEVPLELFTISHAVTRTVFSAAVMPTKLQVAEEVRCIRAEDEAPNPTDTAPADSEGTDRT